MGQHFTREQSTTLDREVYKEEERQFILPQQTTIIKRNVQLLQMLKPVGREKREDV